VSELLEQQVSTSSHSQRLTGMVCYVQQKCLVAAIQHTRVSAEVSSSSHADLRVSAVVPS